MVLKPKSLPARVSGTFRLIADFLVLALIGILWVPLQISQQRHIESEPAETEESVSEAKRDSGKRNPDTGG